MTNFKVGDRFRVVHDTEKPHYNGRTGVVTQINKGHHFPLSGTLENGECDAWKDSEIEKITEKATPEDVREGDRIRLTVEGVVTRKFTSSPYIEMDGGKQYNIVNFEIDLIEKAPDPPKVGGPWRPGLPQGTVIEIIASGYKVFKANGGGWVYSAGFSGMHNDESGFKPENTKIVYLPEDSK